MNRTLIPVVCMSVLLAGSARAQTPQPQTSQTTEAAAAQRAQEQAAAERRERQEAVQRDLRSIVPLAVQVVISKHQGEKRVSSMPFTVTLANDRAKVGVRMGTKVAVPTSSAPSAVTSFTYQDIGTNIDASAFSLDSGRFSLTITIEDSSVTQPAALADTAATQPPPGIRTYRSTSTLILRDGQSAQFTAASDKITGEVIKADVTLTVVK